MRKIADTAAAAAMEEGVAAVVTAIPTASAATSLVEVRHPGNGSGTGSGSRPGAGNDTTGNRSGEPSGNHPTTGRGSSRGAAGSPTNGRLSLAAAEGKKSKAGHARSSKLQNGTVTTATQSTEGRVSGAEAKAGGAATTTVAAAAENLELLSAAGFRPDDQRLLVILQQYVLVNSQAGKEVSRTSEKSATFSFLCGQSNACIYGGSMAPSCRQGMAKTASVT